MKSERSNNVGNVKLGLGYNVKPQSRFTIPKTDRPKSSSPKKRRFESQSHHSSTPQRQRTPQRFQTPQRTVNCFSNVLSHENYRESHVSHQSRNYREGQPSNNSYKPRVIKNSGLNDHMGNSYLKEFTFVDEKGQSKTVTAWIPRDN